MKRLGFENYANKRRKGELALVLHGGEGGNFAGGEEGASLSARVERSVRESCKKTVCHTMWGRRGTRSG